MIPPLATRIPLVRRPKAPALPLGERITHLTNLAKEPAGVTHHALVARTSAILNYAALIASDIGMPDLATKLCWRQHQVFTNSGNLTGEIAVMALMPLINVSRLLTRAGDGEGAYDVLIRLYHAAQKRRTAEVCGHEVDLSVLTTTESDHHKIRQELWTAVLVDGARALARTGRWTEAAEAMAAHRGIGYRLLDGRQIMIMSLMERGFPQQARDTIEATASTEPWENAIAALLRVGCRSATVPTPEQELDHALQEALATITSPEPSTALFQTRVGLAALDLTHDHTSPRITQLHSVIVEAAGLDAYAANDVLNHHIARSYLARKQRQHLDAILTGSGLGVGKLPQAHMHTLITTVDKAEVALRGLLR